MVNSLKNSPLLEYYENGIEIYTEEKNHKIGIVVSNWYYEEITIKLFSAAMDTLKKYGYKENIIVKSVPGSFELPLAAKYLIDYSKVDAVICIGCVIQGETRHFDFICSGVTQGIMDLTLSTGVPISFGVLTTNNLQQAIDRSGGKFGNKGEEAAKAVLEMLFIKRTLQENN